MNVIQIIALLAFGWCIVFCLFHLFRLVKLGKVKDLSQKTGDVKSAVVYSNTIAMLPTQKESAYKHLPTYAAGIMYHIGSFVCILLFFVSFFDIAAQWLYQTKWLVWILIIGLSTSVICGLILFFKRIVNPTLRFLSTIDDYISNLLVTGFQLLSLMVMMSFALENMLLLSNTLICYFLITALLFLYFPFGKLKHAIYYFAARYHVGFFYGWRNTWPPSFKKEKQ